MVLAALLLVHPGLARAGNPSANIDQCRNGSFSSPTACTDGAWVNGNLGPTNAHYREGDSVPFRITFISLTPGTSYSVQIGYDTIVSGKNAYDYLTTYNRTETTADPCSDVSGAVCSSPSVLAIPPDTIPFTNLAATQASGNFTMWGGTLTGAVYDSTYSSGHQQITVTFTANNDTVVLAWGGHVATQSDWGAGNSAGAISGSPYHMSLDACSFGCGAQDRSMKSSVIAQVPATFDTTASSSTIFLGGSVTDTATLSGPNGAVTGSVQFFVCGPNLAGNPDCSTGGVQVGGTKAVSVSGTATSDPFTPSGLGHYCFRAEYTPDQFAAYAAGSHTNQTTECFNVASPATTTVTTPSNGGVITLGGSITDSAVVTGNGVGGSPTGTVSFFVCAQGVSPCASGGTALTGNPVSLTAGANSTSSATSGSFTPHAAGTYCFRGEYTPANDSPYTGSSDASTGECFTVNKANAPTVTTPSNNKSIILGGSITDSAVVSGNAAGGSPTGSVSFFVCAQGVNPCTSGGTALSGNPVSLTAGASNTSSATSGSFTPTNIGTYCFRGEYSGDDNYNASSDASSGECFTVGTAPSTTVTTPSQTSITLGASITDSATVIGNLFGGDPTGTVDFFVCGPIAAPATCSSGGTALPGNPVTLSANGTATSGSFTPSVVGRYCFRGVYNPTGLKYAGSFDSGPNECFAVNKAPSTTVTTPSSDGVITLGDSITDSASVSGNAAGGTPTGSVSFFVCGPIAVGTCSSGGTALSGNPVSLVGGSATSGSFTPTTAGRYCFRGDYSGDDNYNASFDSSSGECFLVIRAPSTTTTKPSSSSIVLGGSLTDSASVSVSGEETPTGTVSFFVCGPMATGTCSSDGSAVGTAVALSGGNATSAAFTPPSAGRYCFRGEYSGDDNYNPSSDSSASECFTVSPATGTLRVVKNLVPGDDPGLFNLRIDGTTLAANVGNGGATATLDYPTGSHTISETAGTGTSLSDYTSGIVCRDNHGSGSVVASGDGTSLDVNLAQGADVVCTIANTRNPLPPGTLTVVKSLAPTNDPGKFNLQIDGATEAANVGNGGTTGAKSASIGNHTVGETAGTGTSLSDYNSSISCVNGASTVATGSGAGPLTVNVPSGAAVVCTISNTRKFIDLAVTKTASPSSTTVGSQVTYTMVATNNGPGTATGVVATDTLPAEVTFVSVQTTKGTCSGTTVVTCQLGTMASGESVTITIVVTATTPGTFTNTITVVGNEPESNTANNTATATITVAGPFVPPPNACYALTVNPHALTVGHRTVLTVRVTQAGKPVKGARVQVKGAGILKLSGPTNAKGIVKIHVKPAKPGIVLITSVNHKGCGKQRVGAIGAFTPPVTG